MQELAIIYMEQDGICASGFYSGVIRNCCSTGMLSVIDGTSSKTVCPIWKGGGSHIHKNNYYLSGIQGIFTLNTTTGDSIFYKTLEGLEIPEGEATPKTTTDVVDALNYYIAHPDSEVNTKGWCKWVVGDDNLPALDFNYEWDPTAGENGTGAFVKVNN